MMARVTCVLAPEHDERAVAALDAELARLRAVRLWRRAGHAGSQEIESRWDWVRGRVVRTHRETYVGLTVMGAAALVEPIAAAVRGKLGGAAT